MSVLAFVLASGAEEKSSDGMDGGRGFILF